MSTDKLETVTPLPDPLHPMSQDAVPVEQPAVIPDGPQEPERAEADVTPKEAPGGPYDPLSEPMAPSKKV